MAYILVDNTPLVLKKPAIKQQCVKCGADEFIKKGYSDYECAYCGTEYEAACAF